MLPLQQAYEVRESVMEYLKATFRFKERDVHESFYNFLSDKKNGIFKGPYISLKTPFIKATDEERANIPLDIQPPFPPHKHQLQAFDRLYTKGGHRPEPTLLTTGTGSGKTECFLYPILDYCYRCNQYGKRKGVKVIIMYPMNALATDQAKRLAEIIWNDDRLKDRVDAGLFIGEGQNPATYPTVMGPDHVIENRNAILDTVPDIILTNFKMLDYALMKQEYQMIWNGNRDEQTQLKFLVLDELHTYDGAQGTDVANLIRRLKLKLELQEGDLCPVGTSATIGNGEESKSRLCEYASDVFGECFTADSIIEEHRIKPDDFFGDELISKLPSEPEIRQCHLITGENVVSYLTRIRKIWLPQVSENTYEIGQGLRQLRIVKDLLTITDKGIVTVEQLQSRLEENDEFRKLNRKDSINGQWIIESLLALISLAKQDEKGRFPFLFLQVQLWQRELSGILRYVCDKPKFTWRNDIDPNDELKALPMYYCRDCGASGWVTLRKETDTKFCSDISAVNRAFMDNSSDLLFMNTESDRHKPIAEFGGDATTDESYFIHLRDLVIGAETDPDSIEVRVCAKKKNADGHRPKLTKACPECNAEPLAFIGHKTSTLSSVALSQIFASDFEVATDKDRKILCFTNSVQDAAYDAGFYEARTFRFLFRQSIQQYLKLQDKPISLAELQDGFKKYWKEQLDGDEYYYRMIPADLATHLDLKKDYRTDDGFKEAFKKDFDLRVDWEICSEFGLTAQLGRTLEKTGASATYFPEEKIKEVYDNMVPWLLNNSFGYVVEQEKEFCRFLNGILHRIRIHGAVDHPFLYTYRNRKLSSYDLNKPVGHFLNKTFGGNIKFPRVVGTGYMRNQNDIMECTATLNEKRPNWYYLYFRKCLVNPYNGGLVSGTIDVHAVNELFVQLFDVLVAVGMMNKMPAGDGNYALRPETIMVESKVKHIKCATCQSMLSVAMSDTLSKGTHCLDYKCQSCYSVQEQAGVGYYQAVYNRKTSPRIYAHEHTGVLDRELRENIETQFKNHPNFDSINTLCATSTLEMGIDIGDLNVISNTSVPPKPSNFLQRVGRAGRKQGSALVLNYAHSGGSHDMYYFAEPKEMMEGEVGTPGCFLQARDILRRHFYAFCIDSWISEDRLNSIPKFMKDMDLTLGLLDDENFFVNRINGYIRQYKMSLVDRFRNQYPEKTRGAMDELTDYVRKDLLFTSIRKAFESRIKQFTNIQQEKAIALATRKTKQESDPVYQEYTERIKSLGQQIGKMLEESVIEFMTNVGLLPNYAFPEAGVTLNASIYIHPAEKVEGGKKPKAEIKEISLNRPASTGIRELAPGNKFYTQKSKLEIQYVNHTDWDDTLKLVRYCPECDCIADQSEPAFKLSCCPKCGSAKWQGSTHKYLRFTEAKCITKKDDAILDDRSDERDTERYHIMKHFMFNDEGQHKAYGLKRIGFGIEFCRDTEITEANYGEQKQLGAPIDINGRKMPGLGYVVCKYCGKATPIMGSAESDAEKLHDRFCKCKDVAFPPEKKDENVFEKVYLYHKMQTEAIKILLPVQDFMGTSASVQLFKAGLELGLRHYYKSSPDHIRIEEYMEKNRVTDQMDYYLVMYDTIPGGTGYLSKLFSKKAFGELMRTAYEHIRDCECKLDGKDGCYHCILTYGNQYKRANLSRQRAEELFDQVVEQVDLWEDIDGGLGQLAQTGVIESSELERWFVELMRQTAEKRKGWTWRTEYDADDEYYYELDIDEPDLKINYTIRRQYDLGPALGVSDRTIPDFQFICNRAEIHGQKIADVNKVIPQWAIYTDGYQYHATEECHRFYGDLHKREAIRNRKQADEYGNYKMLTWTLTWEDLDIYQKKDTENHTSDAMYIDSYKPAHVFKDSFVNDFIHEQNNFDRLLFMLTHPIYEQQVEELKRYLASWSVSFDQDAMIAETDFLHKTSIIDGAVTLKLTEEMDAIPIYIYSINQGLKDVDKTDWMDFWRRYNILQFFDGGEAEDNSAHEMIAANPTGTDFSEIVEAYPDEYQPLALAALQKGFEIEDGGDFNATDEDGTALGSAGFGVHKLKFFVDPYSDEDKKSLEAHGYEEESVDGAMNKINN